jgi:hypothetical protein
MGDTTQRCLLETIIEKPPAPEEGQEAPEEDSKANEAETLFERAQSYIHIRVSSGEPMNPQIDPTLAPSSEAIAQDF